MKQFWMGVALLSLVSVAQATLITETFVVTLPSASVLYSAGHAFTITATYDNAGTVMHEWEDGSDGMADFGSPDDTNPIESTQASTGYAVLSDATISINGLLFSAGALNDDVFDVNYAQYFESLADDYWSLVYQADSIAFSLKGERSSGESHQGRDYFSLTQYFVPTQGDSFQEDTSGEKGPAGSMISRSSVPEPTTLALLGLGLVGVGFARRRKGQARTG